METAPGEGGSAEIEHVEGDVNVGGGESAEPTPEPADGGGESGGEGGE